MSVPASNPDRKTSPFPLSPLSPAAPLPDAPPVGKAEGVAPVPGSVALPAPLDDRMTLATEPPQGLALPIDPGVSRDQFAEGKEKHSPLDVTVGLQIVQAKIEALLGKKLAQPSAGALGKTVQPAEWSNETKEVDQESQTERRGGGKSKARKSDVKTETTTTDALEFKATEAGEVSVGLNRRKDSKTLDPSGERHVSQELEVQAGLDLSKGEGSLSGKFEHTSQAPDAGQPQRKGEKKLPGKKGKPLSKGGPKNALPAGQNQAPAGSPAQVHAQEVEGGVTLGENGVEGQVGYKHTSTSNRQPPAGAGSAAPAEEKRSLGGNLQVDQSGTTVSVHYGSSRSTGPESARTKDQLAVSGQVKIGKDGGLAGAGGAVTVSRTDAAGGKSQVGVRGGFSREDGVPSFQPLEGAAAEVRKHQMTLSQSFEAEAGISVGQGAKGGSRGTGLGLGVGQKTSATLERSVTDAEKQRIETSKSKPGIPELAAVSDAAGVNTALQVGDVVTYKTDSKFQATVPVKAGMVSGGVGVTVSGGTEIQVQRLEGNQVRLRVTPDEQARVTTSAAAGFGAVQAGVEALGAKALVQEFVFDLNSPQGKEAYAKAMKGELPAGFGTDALKGEARDVAGRLSTEPAEAGYRPTLLGQVELKAGTASGSLLGFGQSETLTQQDSREVSFERGPDGKLQAVRVEDVALQARKTDLNSVWTGRRSETSSAALRVQTHRPVEGTASPRTELAGIDLRESIADNNTTHAELSAQLKEINKATGLELKSPEGQAGFGGTEIGLQARITPQQVQQVAALTPQRIRQLFSEAKDPHNPKFKRERELLNQVVQEMQTAGRAAGSPEEKLLAQAKVLGEYAQGNAGEWMGILHKAVGLQPQLSSTAEAYTDPVALTGKLAQQKDRLPVRQVSAEPGAAREAADLVLNQVGGASARTAEGLAQLERDPILTDVQKNLHRTELTQAGAELERLGGTDQLDGPSRARLLQEVMSYSGRDDEKKLMEQLVQGCPPDQLKSLLENFQPSPLDLQRSPQVAENLVRLAVQQQEPEGIIASLRIMAREGMRPSLQLEAKLKRLERTLPEDLKRFLNQI